MCSTCLPIDFLAVRWHSTADHKWTMLAKFNVVAYGDGDGGAGSGQRDSNPRDQLGRLVY